MPEIAREGKFILRVHRRNEHPPPHVHVYYDGTVVRVSLIDLVVLDKVNRHIPKQLFQAVRKHRLKALREWERLNEKGDDL
jgi:hypothetical protein